MIAGHGALRANHFDGGEGPDLDLFLGVGERLLREGEVLLLHFHVFVGVDEVPVHVFDLVDGGDGLQAERHIGNSAVVLGDLNETGVGGEAEALQQVLRKFEIETGVQLRAQHLERCVRNRLPLVVESHRHISAPLESLLVQEISSGGVDRGGRTESTGWKDAVVIDLKCAREDRIEAGDERTAAESGDDEASGASASATGRDRSSALAGTDLSAETADAAAGSVLHHAAVDAENGSACFGAPDVSIGNIQVVAGDGDIEIVFERERDGVIHGDVELAVVHELVNARRVREVGRLDVRRGV